MERYRAGGGGKGGIDEIREHRHGGETTNASFTLLHVRVEA
jgi:hypothetical protein